MTRLDPVRIIHAPTGTTLNAKSWLTEAPLRMLQNNLDPDVAERPKSWSYTAASAAPRATGRAFDKIVETLKRLDDDQTLLVQSGKPVGVFRTHADAPRVLIANSNLVPHWATGTTSTSSIKGLMMYGQMTAGSWIYIGAQGIVQGTYETFVEMAASITAATCPGAGCSPAASAAWGAQPLAAVMAGASCLAVECRKSSIEMRLRTGYLDTWTDNLDEALRLIDESQGENRCPSACSATSPTCCPSCSAAASSPIC
jgi:urocanate hydratase